MNPQGNPTWAEQNNWADKTQDTIVLYEKAEKIADLIGTEEAKQHLKELKQVTISKLHDLQLETSNNLHDLQWDIDFSIGTINETEFTDIEDEYADVEELLENLPTPDVPEELSWISNTDFSNLSTDEAQRILSFLTDWYLSYPESSWWPASYTNTLSEANSQEDIRVAQQILIDKIHGEGTFQRWYTNDGMVLWYSWVEWGNFLKSQEDFENQLISGEVFNALMFANYISYLKSQNGGDITSAFEYVIENSGDRMDRIEAFIWESNNENVSLIKNELIAAELFSPEEWFIGAWFESIKRKWFELLTSGILWFNELVVDSGENIASVLVGIQETLDWSILWFSISSIIWENTVRQIKDMLDSAREKCSAENINTWCFIMSDFIHDIWENLVPDAFRWNIFEQAHNEWVKVLIKKMIETKEVAVSYNSNKWYEVKSLSEFESIVRNDPKYIQQETHKTEVWTYLCGLYRRWEKFTPEYLTSVFWETNLFSILSDFKNWDFEWESFDGVSWDEFYSPYLAGFDVAMQWNIRDTIEQSNPTQINAVIQGGEWKEDTISTLASCPLCKRIDEYDNLTDITIALQSPELQEAQPDFYAGLENKKEVLELEHADITLELTQWVQTELWEDIPEGLQLKISETSTATLEHLRDYLSRNPNEVCSIDLKTFLATSPESPFLELTSYIVNNYRTQVDMEGLYETIDNTVNIWFTSQIQWINNNISLAENRVETLRLIPENERTESILNEINTLENSIIEWQEDEQVLQTVQQRASEIETSDIANLNQEQLLRVKELMLDWNISWPEAYNATIWRQEDFSIDEVFNYYEKNRSDIRFIKDTDILTSFLRRINEENNSRRPDDEKIDKIDISDIHPSMRSDPIILKELQNLTLSDINLIPESYFSASWNHDLYINLMVLFKATKNYAGNNIEKLILTKVNRINISSTDKLGAITIISDLLKSWSELVDKDKIIQSLPTDIFEYDHSWILDAYKDQIQVPVFTAEYLEANFQDSYNRIRTWGVTASDNDYKIINEYFKSIWVVEKRTQFIGLLQQWIITLDSLNSIIPNLEKTELYREVVIAGIQHRWINFTELLPASWHSDPVVIKETLKYYFHKPDNVDNSIWMHVKSSWLNKASNILSIESAYGLYSAYEGLEKDDDLLWELFWNKFDSEHSLEWIMDEAAIEFDTKFSQSKYNELLEVSSSISERFQKSNDNRRQISEMKESFNEDSFNKWILVQSHLNSLFNSQESKAHIDNILEALNWNLSPDVSAIKVLESFNQLLSLNSIEWVERETYISNFLKSIEQDSAITLIQYTRVKLPEDEITGVEDLFQKNPDWSFSVSNSFEYDENNVSSNPLIAKFQRIQVLYPNEFETALQAFMSEYNIEANSNVWKLITWVLKSETIRTITHVLQDNVEELTHANSPEEYQRIIEVVQRKIETGEVDLSKMVTPDVIAQELWITISDSGKIIFPPKEQKENISEKLKSEDNNATTSRENMGQTIWEISWSDKKPILKYDWEEISITPEEADWMRSNPEAITNFINADKYFSSIGLESIWRNYRKEIAMAMNMSGWDIQINLNDDSLWELEFIKFAQFAYKIANWIDSKPSNKIIDLQNQFNVYWDIHAEDKSLLWDRFITDLNTLWINKELTSGQIAARFSQLANWSWLTQEIKNSI